MNNALVKYDTYEKFQSKRKNVIQEGTDQDNNTRQVCQDSINHILSSGSFNFMVRGKSKTISFGLILVTASKSKMGAIQLRDVVWEANSMVAVVLESCTLKKKLKAELLESIGYSGDADQHVRRFIGGLFGKNNMYLFGCGNAWNIKFDSEENFPSILNLKHNGNKHVCVAVTGRGKTVEKK